MALNLQDKKALVAEVAEVAARAQSVVAAEYRGLTVGQMTELRAKARRQGVYMRVVKNTLARKALAGTSFESVGPKLKGPVRSEEHTSELQSRFDLVCRLLLERKKAIPHLLL